jgi:tetratricopeptide (TPR) repeat protein
MGKTGHTRTLLLIAIGLAVAVELVDVAGWAYWRRTTQLLQGEVEPGSRALTESSLAGLPSAVSRSRRLAGELLGNLEREHAVAVMARIGGLQRRWFPTDPAGFKSQAREHVLGGEIDEGLRAMGAAIERDPRSPYLHRLQALVLRRAGEAEAGLLELAEARALAPDLRRPSVEITPEEEVRVELIAARRRIELHPDRQVQTTLELAELLRRRGKNDEASAALDPFSESLEVRLRRAEWELEDAIPGAAVADLEGLATDWRLPAKARARAWSLLASAREMSGDAEGATSAAGRALEIAPDNPLPYVTLALLAERSGDLDRAMEHLRRAWGVAPSNVKVLLHLARVGAQLGEVGDASYALRRALALVDERERPAVGARLVRLLIESRRLDEAMKELADLLESHPHEQELLVLARSLGGRLDPAVTGDGGVVPGKSASSVQKR